MMLPEIVKIWLSHNWWHILPFLPMAALMLGAGTNGWLIRLDNHMTKRMGEGTMVSFYFAGSVILLIVGICTL